MKNGVALIVMPRSSSAWRGSEALWITAAGWAAAAERVYGNAMILTTDRIATPAEVLQYPLSSPRAGHGAAKKRIKIPLVLVTLAKDILGWWRSGSKRNYNYDIPADHVKLVWEQHDLYPGPGKRIARELGVPFIIYVHAPQVWEAAKWGIRRPLWGNLLEKLEARSLRGADVIACVSHDVQEKMVEMGVDRQKILISPMAVDPHLFSLQEKAGALQQEMGIGSGKMIIGWTGSFRGFHGLDLLIMAFKEVHARRGDSVLVLIGDGPERPALQNLCQELGLVDAVIFAGKRPFAEIPRLIYGFDIAIVSARDAANFHYSPLKLREYLAAGRPTLAPDAGEIPLVFKDREHLLLYKAGDISDIVNKLMKLVEDAVLREQLGKRGLDFILSSGTWDVELQKALAKLSATTSSLK